MMPQHYRISTLAEEEVELDMEALVVSAKVVQFVLTSKRPDLETIKTVVPIRQNTDVHLTMEFACAYSEYTVMKTD